MSLFKNKIRRFKGRKKRIPFFRFIIFAAVIAFFGKSVRVHTSGDNQEMQKASIMPMLDPLDRTIEEALEKPINYYIHSNMHSLKVKPGDSFYSILSQHDITRDRSNEIYKHLKPLGLTSIYPGDSVVVHKKFDGQVDKFAILSKSLCWYEVNWSDSFITAKKRPVEVSTYICFINGILETSMSQQMNSFGVSDAITGKFADIFAWDINFFTDPRKGDIFQIIFEQKYAEGKFIGYGDILAARYVTQNKTYYAFGFRDSDGILRYYDEKGNAVQKQFLKAPLRYSRISSGYSYNRRHPILGIVRPHLGIDYAAPTGTPVSAAAAGKVTFAGRKGGYGNFIILSHGGAYETYYGHLQKIFVRQGERVEQSQIIGTVGATGLATGPHLDYRMKRGAQFVNPNTISLPSNKSIKESDRIGFEKIKAYGMVNFNKRFSEETGLKILEIRSPEITNEVVEKVSRNTGIINDNTSSN